MDVQSLGKRIGDRVLFWDVTFTINERDHVGLIAKNGTGKSTLLSILAGHEGYESGRIIFRNDLKIGYLEQTPTFNPQQTIMEAVLENLNVSEHTDPVPYPDHRHSANDDFPESSGGLKEKAWNYTYTSPSASANAVTVPLSLSPVRKLTLKRT